MRHPPHIRTADRQYAPEYAGTYAPASSWRQPGPLDVWLRTTLWRAYGPASREPMAATLADAVEMLCSDRWDAPAHRP